MGESGRPSLGYEQSKRLIDISVSVAGLILLSPLLAAISLAIRLEDGGPVLFRHRRVGRHFQPFNILKFRTMQTDTPSDSVPFTPPDDERITRVGRLLRKHKLNELPQLINVLRGEMSLVGPRPEVERYVNRFEKEYKDILRARPGITDEASLLYIDEAKLLAGTDDVEKHYLEEILPHKIALSRQYIKTRSPLTDLFVILRTLKALLKR